jgi:hypothetical protein
MRDRPLLVVAARLGEGVIDGFLDQLKTAMERFGLRHLTKALKKTCGRPSSISLRDSPRREERQIPPPSTAGLPPCGSVDAKTGRRAACVCG